MGCLNGNLGRQADGKPYILLVTGYPKPGATVPAHAVEKKQLDRIATFL